jgi:hypothetical protein
MKEGGLTHKKEKRKKMVLAGRERKEKKERKDGTIFAVCSRVCERKKIKRRKVRELILEKIKGV